MTTLTEFDLPEPRIVVQRPSKENGEWTAEPHLRRPSVVEASWGQISHLPKRYNFLTSSEMTREFLVRKWGAFGGDFEDRSLSQFED